MVRVKILKIPEKDPDTGSDDQDYIMYPESEDIYNRSKISDLDPEDISKVKKMIREADAVEDIDDEFNNDESGSDLDIPGSEFDNEQEDYGNEDEENNYYSLGGDDHNDLDEDHDGM